MSKNEIIELWLNMAMKFKSEGNIRWAEYCELNAEVWSLVDATEELRAA